ncbi:uncharacterized protein LOC127931382 [Oncorhynchus keta]|uniref:uncharacterized protein LOC127931382 n=1 Tax=Oncorhynchus keta TaxID=8018 RepID=UPI00227BAD66|nr:uncharacterized protein LOC127931382 [Oncorhynchus keta]XP_052379829.1 uncharacterized protein LOC127931382 [Oncorhynchus keta]
MDNYHATYWSSDPFRLSSSEEEEEIHYRITHQNRTKRRGKGQRRQQQQHQQQRPPSQDSWTWEEILNGEGPWARAGENRSPKAELEAAKAERRQYEEPARQCDRYERQPQNFFGGGHTRCGTKPGSRPELTPRVHDKQRITGQAPCYAVKRTVSPVRVHSPVRYRAAPRECHASVGIEPGRMVPAQRVWSPVRSLGPGYPAPALRAVSPWRWEGAVRPLPALRSYRATVGVEPRGEVRVVSTRSPVLTHSPVQPVPALWRVRARVVVQPGEVVPRLRTRAPVLPHSPVFQAPPNTKPPEGLPSLVVPVAAPRTRLSLSLLPAGAPACPAPLPERPTCPAPLPERPACPAPLPEPPACPAPLPEPPACPAPLPERPACPAPLPERPACPAPLPEPPACPAPLPELTSRKYL